MSKPQDFKLSTALLLLGSLCLCLGNTLAAAAPPKKEVSSRIVGGTPTTVSAVPYLVNLRNNGRFTCGGTLVTPTHVVTAAHCVKGVSASSLTVTGGVTLLSEAGVRRNVVKVIVPSSFSLSNLKDDVAVLKLASPLTGTNIRAAPLCSVPLNVGDLLQVSGWGLTNENAASVPNQVRTVKVPLISAKDCKAKYQGKAVLYPSMVCASVAGVKDACSGDSGGPGIFKGQLCGIVSWGIGCAQRSHPGVYTNVNKMKAFIQNAIKL